MCFGCGGIGHLAGGMVYVLEKLVSFCALTAVVLCVIATVVVSLGLGVGLGYNYCFVDLKVVTTDAPTTKPSALRQREEAHLQTQTQEPDYTDSSAYRRSVPTRTTKQAPPMRTSPLPAIKHTMVIPLNADFDFPTLLLKLRGRKRNVTLELIT